MKNYDFKLLEVQIEKDIEKINQMHKEMLKGMLYFIRRGDKAWVDISIEGIRKAWEHENFTMTLEEYKKENPLTLFYEVIIKNGMMTISHTPS